MLCRVSCFYIVLLCIDDRDWILISVQINYSKTQVCWVEMCYLYCKVATNRDFDDLLDISAAASLQQQMHVQSRPRLMSLWHFCVTDTARLSEGGIPLFQISLTSTQAYDGMAGGLLTAANSSYLSANERLPSVFNQGTTELWLITDHLTPSWFSSVCTH